MNPTAHRLGNLLLGSVPRVVGTVSEPATLSLLAAGREPECDVVEVRLDRMDRETEGWLEESRRIERRGVPVILTIRLAAEGGGWETEDTGRQHPFELALRALAAVDVELRSPLLPGLCALAEALDKTVIVSYHDFEGTPAVRVLMDLIGRAASSSCAVPKIATMLRSGEDAAVLREVLARDFGRPVCVLGMGVPARETRTEFALKGSCLTYGYLDSPVAPGQPPSAALVEELSRLLPAYREDVAARRAVRIQRATRDHS